MATQEQASFPTPPLIWITQGKTQHAAHLLETSVDGSRRVRWVSSHKTEWLQHDIIIDEELSPRRQCKPTTSISSPPRSRKRQCEEVAFTRYEISGARRISIGDQAASPQEDNQINTSKLATDESVARDSPYQSAIEQEENDDSSIEILLTIMPPTPQKKPPNRSMPPSEVAVSANAAEDLGPPASVARPQPSTGVSSMNQEANGTCTLGEHTPGTGTSSSHDKSSNNDMEKTTSMGDQAEVDNRKMPAVKEPPSQNEVQPTLQDSVETPYSVLSSAYLQNLAEICHTIMTDRRWRVGKDQRALLSWECGDDLSAIIPLSRRYRPLPATPKAARCRGLLCQCQRVENQDEDNSLPAPEKPSESLADCKKEASRQEDNAYSQQTIVPKGSDSLLLGKDARRPAVSAEDRCMYLYCRLFYRKGPWFTINDAYFSYYAPKQLRVPSASPSNAQPASKKHSLSTPAKKQDFFATAKKAAAGGKVGSNKGFLFNEVAFRQHIEALETFFTDLIGLQDMGLARTFVDERECGKTCGKTSGPLRAEERQRILSKLGGSKGKTPSKQRGRSMTEPASRQNSAASSASSENEIWNQMTRQRSISAQFMSTSRVGDEKEKGSKGVLPVISHVNQTVIEKLAEKIVLACNPSNSVVAPLMKGRKAIIKDAIGQVLKSLKSTDQAAKGTASGPHLESLLSKIGTCIRLREAPRKTLRRACRVFLCATTGPGQMRSEGGTNGWKSVLELDGNIAWENTKLEGAQYLSNVVTPSAWHRVSYPGLRSRFGLASYLFQEAHQPLPMSSSGDPKSVAIQVFSSADSFFCWEHVCELRAIVDYLIEVNELVLYTERKRSREEEADSEEKTENEAIAKDSCREQCATMDSSLDFLSLLVASERKDIFSRFVSRANFEQLYVQLEDDVSQLFTRRLGHACPPMKTECEEILCVMGVVIKNILTHRIATASEANVHSTVARPWLRHMSCEACLAYILWDIIPILERRKFYDFAIQSLELLVYGKTSDICGSIERGSFPEAERRGMSKDYKLTEAFAHFLLSRRARGKALDRIVIDVKHVLTQAEKAKKAQNQRKKRTKGQKATVPSQTPQILATFANQALDHALVQHAAVPFSSIRALSRRLKQPLRITLESRPSREAQELGLRLRNDLGLGCATNQNRYSDWVPVTDHAIANSMATEESAMGQRCSFVSHEDDEDKAGFRAKLNVEQLAMEFYASGRLPPSNQDSDGSLQGGGWQGWHDEGGLVRALFRVLCFDILGMDWSCKQCQDGSCDEYESTVHLSPYQGAPFDLHVGFEIADPLLGKGLDTQPNRGFYLRRRKRIESFLTKLGGLNRQEVSDLVWNSIAARRRYRVGSSRKDESLERDIVQCRTLSMVAAGFGGAMLKDMIRCLLFDYRHYSGGLPDLLLVRAKRAADDSLVDLGEWVGEAFDKEYVAGLEQEMRANLLGDRDDDFLGCSKVGESGGGNARNRSGRNRSRQKLNSGDNSDKHNVKIPELPARLQLIGGGSQVDVECMFVEVKSKTDRLDGRQEDWLNVLDRVGNSRVCKFSDGKPKGKKKAKTSYPC